MAILVLVFIFLLISVTSLAYATTDANELQVSYGGAGRYTVEEFEAEQIASTDLGNLDVLLAPSPSVPKPKQFTMMNIIFLKPDSRTPINHIDYKVLISKDGKEVYSTSGISHTHSFFDTVSNYFTNEGKYLVSVSVTGFEHQDIPVETAIFTLIVGDVDEEQTTETSQSSQKTDTGKETKPIPDWIRNNAHWWSLTQISDQDFAKGLEYLIKEDIINVPKGTASEGQAEQNIPDWLRKNAGWWSQGLLSDDEFLKSIQYLINNGFIKI